MAQMQAQGVIGGGSVVVVGGGMLYVLPINFGSQFVSAHSSRR